MLEEIKKTSRSIVITAPQDFNIEDANITMSIEVNKLPEGIGNGDKCFIVSNDIVVGWGEISELKECIVSKQNSSDMSYSYYIDIKPPFHQIDNRIPMKDFKGYRYFFYNN